MAFEKKEIKRAFVLFLAAVIQLTLIDAKNFDCHGKAFHCLNSTHFMICVDLGDGISKTIDDFLLPCPPPTVCMQSNNFECEYYTTTTLTSISSQSEVTKSSNETALRSLSEDNSTTIIPFWYKHDDLLKLEKYYNTIDITPIESGQLGVTQKTISSVNSKSEGSFVVQPTYSSVINEGFTADLKSTTELKNRDSQTTTQIQDINDNLSTLFEQDLTPVTQSTDIDFMTSTTTNTESHDYFTVISNNGQYFDTVSTTTEETIILNGNETLYNDILSIMERNSSVDSTFTSGIEEFMRSTEILQTTTDVTPTTSNNIHRNTKNQTTIIKLDESKDNFVTKQESSVTEMTITSTNQNKFTTPLVVNANQKTLEILQSSYLTSEVPSTYQVEDTTTAFELNRGVTEDIPYFLNNEKNIDINSVTTETYTEEQLEQNFTTTVQDNSEAIMFSTTVLNDNFRIENKVSETPDISYDISTENLLVSTTQEENIKSDIFNNNMPIHLTEIINNKTKNENHITKKNIVEELSYFTTAQDAIVSDQAFKMLSTLMVGDDNVSENMNTELPTLRTVESDLSIFHHNVSTIAYAVDTNSETTSDKVSDDMLPLNISTTNYARIGTTEDSQSYYTSNYQEKIETIQTQTRNVTVEYKETEFDTLAYDFTTENSVSSTPQVVEAASSYSFNVEVSTDLANLDNINQSIENNTVNTSSVTLLNIQSNLNESLFIFDTTLGTDYGKDNHNINTFTSTEKITTSEGQTEDFYELNSYSNTATDNLLNYSLENKTENVITPNAYENTYTDVLSDSLSSTYSTTPKNIGTTNDFVFKSTNFEDYTSNYPLQDITALEYINKQATVTEFAKEIEVYQSSGSMLPITERNDIYTEMNKSNLGVTEQILRNSTVYGNVKQDEVTTDIITKMELTTNSEVLNTKTLNLIYENINMDTTTVFNDENTTDSGIFGPSSSANSDILITTTIASLETSQNFNKKMSINSYINNSSTTTPLPNFSDSIITSYSSIHDDTSTTNNFEFEGKYQTDESLGKLDNTIDVFPSQVITNDFKNHNISDTSVVNSTSQPTIIEEDTNAMKEYSSTLIYDILTKTDETLVEYIDIIQNKSITNKMPPLTSKPLTNLAVKFATRSDTKPENLRDQKITNNVYQKEDFAQLESNDTLREINNKTHVSIPRVIIHKSENGTLSAVSIITSTSMSDVLVKDINAKNIYSSTPKYTKPLIEDIFVEYSDFTENKTEVDYRGPMKTKLISRKPNNPIMEDKKEGDTEIRKTKAIPIDNYSTNITINIETSDTQFIIKNVNNTDSSTSKYMSFDTKDLNEEYKDATKLNNDKKQPRNCTLSPFLVDNINVTVDRANVNETDSKLIISNSTINSKPIFDNSQKYLESHMNGDRILNNNRLNMTYYDIKNNITLKNNITSSDSETKKSTYIPLRFQMLEIPAQNSSYEVLINKTVNTVTPKTDENNYTLKADLSRNDLKPRSRIIQSTLTKLNITTDYNNKQTSNLHGSALSTTLPEYLGKVENQYEINSTRPQTILKSQTNKTITEPINKTTNINLKTHSLYKCLNHFRGKYSDPNDCQKFYICIGRTYPIVGQCPVNTVFSESLKQCTRNLSHCMRNNQFKCLTSGRFSDMWARDTYYICVKHNKKYIRFKLKCRKGYYLNRATVSCVEDTSLFANDSYSTASTSSNSGSEMEFSLSQIRSKPKYEFKCVKEGVFSDPSDCRKYYVCSKNSKSEFRRKKKKCDSDEVFHKRKKKCVDEDSYECRT